MKKQSSITRAAGTATVYCTNTIAGTAYTLEYCTNLTTGTWQPVGTQTAPGNSASQRIAKLNKLNGTPWGAGSLGAIQPGKSNDWRDHFTCTSRKRHQHSWLTGTDNAVCSRCGLTVPKDKTHLYEN